MFEAQSCYLLCRWVDPVGAIVISLYIVWRWVVMCKGQVRMLMCMYRMRQRTGAAGLGMHAALEGACMNGGAGRQPELQA